MIYLMKAVSNATFDVRRALISAISSLHHLIRSHVTLLLDPRLSYLLTRACRSSSTFVHPFKITLSRASLAGCGGGTRRVSSDSFSIACNDRTSPLIWQKLSDEPLPILQLALLPSIVQHTGQLSKAVILGSRSALIHAAVETLTLDVLHHTTAVDQL